MAAYMPLLSLVLGASSDAPHFHKGKLEQYHLGPPSVLLSPADVRRLRQGKPVMHTLESNVAGARRMIMVQDIPAPNAVVMDRIMDLEQYGAMVDNVQQVANYETSTHKAVRTIKSTYDVSVIGMKFKYFMEHHYDPAQNCMVFHLDYSKRSDIDDSVGYWYVQPSNGRTSRVYYSCECKLRGWVPGPVYSVLTKEAMTKATTWVSRESIKEWKMQQQSDGLVRFVSDVRERAEQLQSKLPQLRMPEPPLFVSRLVQKQRRRIPTHYISNPPPKVDPSSL